MEEELEQQRGGSSGSGAPSFAHPRDSSLMKETGLQKDKEGFELFNNDFNDFGTAEDLDLLFNSTEMSR
jgi:hypothetical protein